MLGLTKGLHVLVNNEKYFQVLEEIKTQIKTSQHRIVLGANKELMSLYWSIGRIIIENTKYGTGFIKKLSQDISSEFPGIRGFSVTNLKYMRKFAEVYPDFRKVQQGVALLPWRNNITLLTKVKDDEERQWYIEQNIENGWNNTVLLRQIESNLYVRQGLVGKTTNYESSLPNPLGKLAEEILKDPYIFDFIEKYDGMIEREIEDEMVANIAKTIMELGTGFTFVGNQYHLEVAGKDYYIDLLFYNTKLRSFVVIELKSTEFKPEYAGKINFYLSAVDDQLKHKSDNPSIGILLCKTKDALTAEYALKDIGKPIGVSEYKLSGCVPESLVGTLPSVEDLERQMRLDFGE